MKPSLSNAQANVVKTTVLFDMNDLNVNSVHKPKKVKQQVPAKEQSPMKTQYQPSPISTYLNDSTLSIFQ